MESLRCKTTSYEFKAARNNIKYNFFGGIFMKVKKMCINILSIFLASVFTLLTACSSNQSSGSSSGASQSDPEEEKAISSLTGLENNIEITIKALGGPATQQETQQNSSSLQSSSSDDSQGSQSSQQGQKSQGSQSSQQGQQSQGSQSSQQGQQSQGGQSSQQGQQSKASSTNQQNPMDKVSKIVDQMHYQWNDLMPEAIKKGAKKELIDNIDNAINKLSVTATSKNKMNALLAANQLYEYIPDLYTLIKPKPSPEIKRVLYYSRNVIINSSVANWTQADSDIKSLKSTWDLYKNGLSKDQKDVANKLELSIDELEKVVKGRNQSLVNIKGKVEFSNIMALEKATENESGNSSKQSSES